MYLSIIIPTLNEQAYIQNTLNQIKLKATGNLIYEIIIIDAGSTDNTLSFIENEEIIVITNEKFKGKKYSSLNHGANIGNGSVLMFLDADCTVPANFDLLIKNALNEENVSGGAFEYKSENRSFMFRIIELINRMRYRVDGVYFGDQGIFCLKSTFEKLGGYPEEPLMEAAFFCRLMKKYAKMRLIETAIITSSRRFERGGVWTVFFKDMLIWMRFLIHLDIKKYAPAYWQANEIMNTKSIR